MARPNPQTLGEQFDASVFQPAFANQPQCSGNSIRSPLPRGSSRTTLRPATKAWPKSRFRGGCCCRKIPAVLLFCRRRGADRPAVHSAANHADVELSVESRVPRQPRSRTDLPIEHKGSAASSGFLIIVDLAAISGRFRTTLKRSLSPPATSENVHMRAIHVRERPTPRLQIG